MATFTTVPSFGAREQRKPRVRSSRFGDGYEQRAADGINVDAQVWSLRFQGLTEAQADTIEAFDWTPQGGAQGKYLCREWSRSYETLNGQAIAASFEQVFE